MRFTESKRRTPWLLIVFGILIIAVLFLGFCQFQPTPETVEKTIVFEAD